MQSIELEMSQFLAEIDVQIENKINAKLLELEKQMLKKGQKCQPIQSVDFDQVVGNVDQNFKCYICFRIVEDPISCDQCDKITCNSCIPLNEKCFHCQKNPHSRSRLHRMIRDQYLQIQFKDEHCGQIELFSQKHLHICNYQMQCLFCNQTVDSKQIAQHVELCKKSTQICQKCNKEFSGLLKFISHQNSKDCLQEQINHLAQNSLKQLNYFIQVSKKIKIKIITNSECFSTKYIFYCENVLIIQTIHDKQFGEENHRVFLPLYNEGQTSDVIVDLKQKQLINNDKCASYKFIQQDEYIKLISQNSEGLSYIPEKLLVNNPDSFKLYYTQQIRNSKYQYRVSDKFKRLALISKLDSQGCSFENYTFTLKNGILTIRYNDLNLELNKI